MAAFGILEARVGWLDPRVDSHLARLSHLLLFCIIKMNWVRSHDDTDCTINIVLSIIIKIRLP